MKVKKLSKKWEAYDMSNRIKRVFKLIWAWNEGKEEKWLSEMAQKGWFLKNYNFGLYTFFRGDADNYIYKLDYRSDLNMDTQEYKSIFADSGWEHVTQFLGWHYFRTREDECKYPDIYSDNTSKIQKYKGLLRVLAIIIIVNLFNFINLIFLNQDIFSLFEYNFMSIFRLIVIATLTFLIYGMYRIWKIIKNLEDEL